jgi:hypothetical protein
MHRCPIIRAALVALFAGACVGHSGPGQGLLTLMSLSTVPTGNRLLPTRLDIPTPGKTGKVDVCHREGNGRFHRINVSAHALGAHLSHGDGVPGGLVPDDPSRKFDSTCTAVDSVVCPCRFTVDALQELNTQFGDLGSDYDFLSTNVVTQIFSRSDVGDRRANRFVVFQAPGPDWPQSFVCLRRVYEPEFVILSNLELPVTSQEAQGCVQDLETLARVLGVPIPARASSSVMATR